MKVLEDFGGQLGLQGNADGLGLWRLAGDKQVLDVVGRDGRFGECVRHGVRRTVGGVVELLHSLHLANLFTGFQGINLNTSGLSEPTNSHGHTPSPKRL